MVANRKVTGRAKAMPVGLAMGLGGSLTCTILMSAVLATLINKEAIPLEAAGYGSVVTLLLSAALGAWISAAAVKRQWLAMCLSTAALYYVSLLCLTALFFGGQFEGMGVTALMVLCGAAIVILLGLKGERGVKYSRKKLPSR